jgi:hypothetical protein
VSKPFAAALFLKRLRSLLAAKKVVFQPRNRDKTWEFMLEEELDVEDVFDILTRLEVEHCQWGPDEDHDGSGGNVMLFFCPYRKKTLYIKLKIWPDAHGDAGAVISFHEEGKYD